MMKHVRKSALALTAAIALSFSFADSANADAGAGALRLGADIGVIGLTHVPDAIDETNFQFGIWGEDVYRPAVGVSVGFQIIEPLIIGARTGFGAFVSHVDTPGPLDHQTFTSGLFALIPYVEYMFLTGNIRPFVGGELGFQLTFPDGGDTQAGFIAGALGGVHIFATPSFSISPTAFLDFIYRGADENAGFAFGGVVTLQGWIN